MALSREIIVFDSTDKSLWLSKISELHSLYALPIPPHHISLKFADKLKVSEIEPVHLVTLACLIQYLVDRGHEVYMSKSNAEMYDYILNDLDFSAYWKGGKNHVNANSSSDIFNLWRIVEAEKDLYAKNVERYFTQNYFKDKDLSAISVSLVEAFYNIFDHAEANENAFSVLRYDKDMNRLSVAIADFGIGIARSVRNFNSEIN